MTEIQQRLDRAMKEKDTNLTNAKNYTKEEWPDWDGEVIEVEEDEGQWQ